MIKPEIKVENVVANARIADSLDLEYIESKLEDAVFTKKKFPGLVYRTKEPKSAFLIFRSGKVVCTGSKTAEGVRVVMDKLAADLRNLGIDVVEHPEFKVQNIVASANLGRELNLGAIVVGLELEGMEYEPEVFPGLVYRIKEPKSAILIFSSGRLVITGGKTVEDCERSVNTLLTKLSDLELI
ncbi:MAG: TATA-box-binding protein [Candidatus Syntrophoarchaeum sp.]|nr:TATA-box-binding protein [Methanomicrobia archaeon]MBL7118073.1 TATA-box-binding protein [Candidatus Syntrophoarchaeum sp.]